MILVTGATGNVGRALMEVLRDRDDVIAGVREPDGMPQSRKFDFTDEETWAPALSGVRSLFLLLPPGLPKAQDCFRGVLAKAGRAGVERVVFNSIRNADRLKVLPHRGLEQVIEESGIAWTHLRPNDWMQNFATQPIYRDGIRDGKLWAAGGESRTSYLDVRDLAEVAAKALGGGYELTALSLTGPANLSLRDVAATLTEVLGRHVNYRHPSLPGFALHARQQGAPWALAAVMTSIGLVARLGYSDGIDPDLQRVLGRPSRSFAQFARDYREAWA